MAMEVFLRDLVGNRSSSSIHIVSDNSVSAVCSIEADVEPGHSCSSSSLSMQHSSHESMSDENNSRRRFVVSTLEKTTAEISHGGNRQGTVNSQCGQGKRIVLLRHDATPPTTSATEWIETTSKCSTPYSEGAEPATRSNNRESNEDIK